MVKGHTAICHIQRMGTQVKVRSKWWVNQGCLVCGVRHEDETIREGMTESSFANRLYRLGWRWYDDEKGPRCPEHQEKGNAVQEDRNPGPYQQARRYGPEHDGDRGQDAG